VVALFGIRESSGLVFGSLAGAEEKDKGKSAERENDSSSGEGAIYSIHFSSCLRILRKRHSFHHIVDTVSLIYLHLYAHHNIEWSSVLTLIFNLGESFSQGDTNQFSPETVNLDRSVTVTCHSLRI
jgi:hypothetical protein